MKTVIGHKPSTRHLYLTCMKQADSPASMSETSLKPDRLAFGDIEESGRYWANDSVHSVADGKIQAW